MSSSKVKLSKKSSKYHHGDLRQALIDTARTVLAEDEAELSLREVARRVGVSHASAYYHFKDKAGLITAIAIAAFEELSDNMKLAYDEADEATVERLKAVAAAYIAFALNHPQEFRLMYLPELRNDAVRTDVETAGRAGYGHIVQLVGALQDEGRVVDGDPERIAISTWAMVHGLATLMLDGPLYRNARDKQGRATLIADTLEHLLFGIFKR